MRILLRFAMMMVIPLLLAFPLSSAQPYITTLFCRCEQPGENIYDWRRRTSFMGDGYTTYLNGNNNNNHDEDDSRDSTGYFEPPKPARFHSRYYQYLSAIMSMFRNEPGTKNGVDKYVVEYSITILPKNDPVCIEQNMDDYNYRNRRLHTPSSDREDGYDDQEDNHKRRGRKLGSDERGWRTYGGPLRRPRGSYWTSLFRNDDAPVPYDNGSYSGKGKGKGGSGSKSAKSSKSRYPSPPPPPKPNRSPKEPHTRPPKEPQSPPERPKIFRCPDRGTPVPDTTPTNPPTIAPTMNNTPPTDMITTEPSITIAPTDFNTTDFPTSNFQTFAPTTDSTMDATMNVTDAASFSPAPTINVVPVPTVPTNPPTPLQRRRVVEYRQEREKE